MVAHNKRDNFGGDDDPTTLCEWVRSFRLKRSQMKRKLRGNLRVNAMLNTALENAEAELRRKQRERFCRWTDFQAKLNKSYGIGNCMKNENLQNELVVVNAEQRETIDDLWKSELSELDSFMRSLSSNNRNDEAKNTYTSNDCSSNVQSDNGSLLQTRSVAVVS